MCSNVSEHGLSPHICVGLPMSIVIDASTIHLTASVT